MTKAGERLIAAAKEARNMISREDQIKLMTTARARHDALVEKWKADGTLRRLTDDAADNATCDERSAGPFVRVNLRDL